MEAPSAPTHRGLVLWKEVLLTVSLLTFWNPPTTAKLTIKSVPPKAAEGKDVLLLVHSLPENLLGYIWYSGKRVAKNHQIASYAIDTQTITPGPAHSGRETIHLNGSLLLQKVTLKDTGYYTIQAITKDLQNEEGTGQLRVYRLTVPEHTSVLPHETLSEIDFLLPQDPDLPGISKGDYMGPNDNSFRKRG